MKTSHVKFISPEGKTLAYAHFGYSDKQLTERAKDLIATDGHDFVEIARFDAEQETTTVWYVS